MHVALFSRCTTVADLAVMEELIRRRPSVVASVAIAGHLMDALAQDEGMTTTLAGSDIEWTRSAWTTPDLTLLPDEFVQSALAYEFEVFDDLGLRGSSLYFEGAPGARLPRIARQADLTCLITPTPEPRTGVLTHLDMIIPCLGASGSIPSPTPTDGVSAQVVSVDRLERRIDEVMALPNCDITTPARYLADHVVGGPFDTSDLTSTPDPLLERKLIRIATRLPSRPSAEVTRLVLEAAAVDSISSDAPPTLHHEVHTALITARARIDASRRRNDDWARVSRLDWDADGYEELQIEQPALSIVVDPHHGARLPVLDDKTTNHPIGWLPGEPLGMLIHTTDPDGNPEDNRMTISGIDERRDAVSVAMEALGQPGMTVGFTVSGHLLQVDYEFGQPPRSRFGPELPLNLGATRLRVDGGDWVEVTDPLAVTGHRFRLEGETRQVLISTMLPTNLFLRPSDDRGVIVWPNWRVDGTGRYSIKIDLNA